MRYIAFGLTEAVAKQLWLVKTSVALGIRHVHGPWTNTTQCIEGNISLRTLLLLLLMVSSSLYVSHMFVTRVLSELGFQSCPSLELVSPLQVTHLLPVWVFLIPLA